MLKTITSHSKHHHVHPCSWSKPTFIPMFHAQKLKTPLFNVRITIVILFMAKKHSFPPNLLAFGMLCSSRAPAASNAGRRHSDSSAANSPRDTARFPVESCLFIGELAACQNLVPLVNIKIAGKWMFIPLKNGIIYI